MKAKDFGLIILGILVLYLWYKFLYSAAIQDVTMAIFYLGVGVLWTFVLVMLE